MGYLLLIPAIFSAFLFSDYIIHKNNRFKDSASIPVKVQIVDSIVMLFIASLFSLSFYLMKHEA